MLALTNGKIFGRNGEVYPGTIVVEGEYIHRVDADGSAPEDARVIDLGGRTVLPGFINAHSHITFFEGGDPTTPDGTVALQAAHNARRALEAGITTVRDVGGVRHLDIALRDAIDQGLVPGPRLLVSGQFIAMTGGHSYSRGIEADGPDNVRKAVRLQAKAGADLIKFMGSGGVADPQETPDEVQFTFEELRAGIDEAHRLGRTVAVHAHPAAAVKAAVKAGADFIEHGTFVDEEAIALLVERGTVLIPTFCVYKAIASDKRQPKVMQENARRVLDEKLIRFAKAVQAGVRWGVGMDNGTFYPPDDVATELSMLVQAGISPAGALLAVTERNAHHLGLHDRGTLEAGKLADIVVVDGDPLQDVGCVRSPWLVLKGGMPS